MHTASKTERDQTDQNVVPYSRKCNVYPYMWHDLYYDTCKNFQNLMKMLEKEKFLGARQGI